MKKGWQIRNLGELCRIRTGKKDVNEGNPDGEFPFFTCAAEHTFSDSYSFDTEALLIAGNGDVGKVSYYKGKFEAYQRTYVISDFAEVLPRFLYLILEGKLKGTVSKQKLGNTMPYIKVGMLTDFQLPVPPLSEQQRIVGILDEAFAGIATAKANAEKNLQNARALFESYLQSVFTQRGKGWVEKRLGDVFEIGSSKRILETEWTSTGVPFYGGKEIVKLAKFGSVHSNAYISEEKYRDYASKYDMPRRDDILITARGTIGVGYVVQEGNKFYYKDGNIISMRGKTPTNPHFMLYAFRSNVMADQLGTLTGTTVRHLPIEKAKELVLRMPGFSAQNTAVEEIRKIEAETQRLESIYHRKLTALEALKKSLLHQAFTGEL